MALGNRLDRALHRGQVVGEVVDHRHPRRDAADLLPPLHALVSAESLGELFDRHALPCQRGKNPRDVLDVVGAEEGS